MKPDYQLKVHNPRVISLLCVQKILDTKGLFQGVEFEKWLNEVIRGSDAQNKTVRDLTAWMSLKNISIREGVAQPPPLPDLSTVGKTDIAQCTSFHNACCIASTGGKVLQASHSSTALIISLENFGPSFGMQLASSCHGKAQTVSC